MSKHTHTHRAPFRPGGARACFWRRIFKDHPHYPNILSLRQNCPSLACAITADRGPASTRGQLDGAGLVSEPNPDAFPSGRELRRESSLGASTKLSTEVGVDGKSGHTPYL